MLKKVEAKFSFKKKRDYNLKTPCCNRTNKDGKFVNYKDLPNVYGYCHSCGKNSLPPPVYEDGKGEKYYWNDTLGKFDKALPGTEAHKIPKPIKNKLPSQEKRIINYIPEDVIWKKYLVTPENNLLKYLRKNYENEKVEMAKEMYAIGTCKDGGTIFWNINKELKVQKAKISFYDIKGRRTSYFKVPYKNEGGYYSCLFGEHLIIDDLKGIQKLVLVESEKTAIVGDITFPKYTWLAYGGANGLTEEKLKALIGHRVLIVPDISSSAIKVMEEKLPKLIDLGINARIWDMRQGKTDEELKKGGVYNMDLEDFIREINNT